MLNYIFIAFVALIAFCFGYMIAKLSKKDEVKTCLDDLKKNLDEYILKIKTLSNSDLNLDIAKELISKIDFRINKEKYEVDIMYKVKIDLKLNNEINN